MPIINFKEVISSSYILEENIALILKNFLQETNIKTKQVYFSVPSPYIFSTNFIVPNIPERNLPQVITFESQKQLPLSVSDIEIEYRYFLSQGEDQANQWLIFLVATPKSYIKKLENICNFTQLKFAGYGAEYFNVESFFKDKPGNFVVIDIGHAYGNICLIKNGKINYANKLKIRAYDYLNSIMNATQYPESQVLDFVAKKGFAFNPEEKDLKNLANVFLDSVASTVQSEITRLETSFLARVDKIYWTGGAVILDNFFDEMLKRLLRYQQEILTPANFVYGDKFKMLKEKSTLFTQVTGLLLKKIIG